MKNISIKIGATNTASQVISRVSLDVTGLSRNLKRLSTAASQSLNNIGGTLQRTGAKITAFAAGGALALGAATRTFANYEQRMNEVGAITGAVGADFKALQDAAKQLGSTTKFSASEAAEGMKFLGMAGFDTKEILAGLPAVLSLAAAGGVELGMAADIASDVSSAFGLSADEIGRVADVIATTATSANTNIEMMGETFKLAAPLAKAAGQSIEEMSAAAGLLGNSGIKATVAGTDLKNILQALAKTGVQGKLRDLGVEALDAEGNIRPMLDVMQELGEKTRNMPGGERLALFAELFKRSAKSAVVLGDVGGEAIDELRGKMENAEGAAEKMADRMNSGLSGALVNLRSAFEGLQISIGEALGTSLEGIVQRLTALIRGTTKWVEKNKGLVTGIGIAVAALGVLGVSMVSAGTAAIALGAALAGLSSIIGTIGAVIGFVFSPAGAIILGVVAAVAALVAQFAIAAHQTGLLSDALGHATGMFRMVMGVARETFGGISDALKAGDFALAAKVAWAGVQVAFWEGLNKLLWAVGLTVPKLWETFKKFLENVLTKTESTMSAVARVIANPSNIAGNIALLKSTMTALGGAFEAGQDFMPMIQDKRDEARAQFEALKQEAARAAADVAKSFEPKEFVGPLKPEGVKEFVGPVKDAIAGLPEVVVPGVDDLLEGINTKIETGLNLKEIPVAVNAQPAALQANSQRLLTGRGRTNDTASLMKKQNEIASKQLDVANQQLGIMQLDDIPQGIETEFIA